MDELGTTALKEASRAEITELQQIRNIGPSIAADLRRIGVSSPHDLLGKARMQRTNPGFSMTRWEARLIGSLPSAG